MKFKDRPAILYYTKSLKGSKIFTKDFMDAVRQKSKKQAATGNGQLTNVSQQNYMKNVKLKCLGIVLHV